MKRANNKRDFRRVLWGVATIVGFLIITWNLLDLGGVLSAQSNKRSVSEVSSVFTPAHSTVGEAVRHFFGIKPEPVQPIPYTHIAHIELAGLVCVDCHDAVDVGPIAHIPSVSLCMDCHEFIATESPAIQMLTSYADRGEEPPWQRVYGWFEEAHVRFNHAPHIRADVDCVVCHGDVAKMTVAERVVDHTMAFCVNCHEQEQASNDCMVCHY